MTDESSGSRLQNTGQSSNSFLEEKGGEGIDGMLKVSTECSVRKGNRTACSLG